MIQTSFSRTVPGPHSFVRGVSVTGVSVTGVSVTGVSVTGVSVTDGSSFEIPNTEPIISNSSVP